jgi:PAS domain S-box-containing protein
VLTAAADTLGAAIGRERAERRQAEAERRYRTLVEQIPAVTYIHAPTSGNGLYYVSPQIERVLGFTPEEWTADRESWFRTLHPDDHERVVAEDRRTDDTGEPFSIEYRQIAKDGRVVWTRDEAVLVRDDRGEPLFWQGVRFDISAQKHTEEQLREAEGRYRTLVENLPAVTYIDAVDERATTVYVSPQVEEMFGYTPEEWRARPELWIDALHPGDRGRVLEEVRLHNTTGVPFEVEYRFRASDGTWRWIRDQAVVVRNDDGRIVLSQGVMFDVTERLAAEEQLRETEAKYRAIVEHIPAAIYLDEPDGSMSTTYVSPQIYDLMGITPQEYRADPETWLTLMAPEHRDEMRRTYLEAVDERRSWVGEYRIQTPDGRDVWIHDETTFVTDENDQPLFLQGVMFDVTERKLAEQALQESERQQREAAERLRALDDMKNTFLAAVSHELRSPLTSILGLSLPLEQTELPSEDRSDLLGRLAANARKLDRLLKDLLDIDRLSRGIVTPKYRPTDLGGLVNRMVESLDVQGERSILVETESVVVPVDPAKVERIVENLLVNAVRHTPADRRIWVRVWSENGGVMLAVEDEGPGVPPELRDVIFEPFRQGPTPSAHSPGTGIGLSLVAMFAELHGGRAWVQERKGGGASFRVFLPGTPVEIGGSAGALTPLSRANAG